MTEPIKRLKARKHGHARKKGQSPTYRTWWSMKQRCLNQECPNYADYGGRGIEIDPSWYDFEGFLSDMDERPEGMSLDRIDVNGDYTPANCRWATLLTQARNKRPYRKASGLPPGVYRTEYGRYRSFITSRGIRVNLGTFATADEAAEIFQFAKRQIRVYEPMMGGA